MSSLCITWTLVYSFCSSSDICRYRQLSPKISWSSGHNSYRLLYVIFHSWVVHCSQNKGVSQYYLFAKTSSDTHEQMFKVWIEGLVDILLYDKPRISSQKPSNLTTHFLYACATSATEPIRQHSRMLKQDLLVLKHWTSTRKTNHTW